MGEVLWPHTGFGYRQSEFNSPLPHWLGSAGSTPARSLRSPSGVASGGVMEALRAVSPLIPTAEESGLNPVQVSVRIRQRVCSTHGEHSVSGLALRAVNPAGRGSNPPVHPFASYSCCLVRPGFGHRGGPVPTAGADTCLNAPTAPVGLGHPSYKRNYSGSIPDGRIRGSLMESTAHGGRGCRFVSCSRSLRL